MAESCKEYCPVIQEFESSAADEMTSELFDAGLSMLDELAAQPLNCPGATHAIGDRSGELECHNRYPRIMNNLRGFILAEGGQGTI